MAAHFSARVRRQTEGNQAATKAPTSATGRKRKAEIQNRKSVFAGAAQQERRLQGNAADRDAKAHADLPR
jgi:hypothetical protein